MLIQINILILDMVLDLTLLHFSHIQISIGVKMLLFLEKTIVHQCMLIKRKKDILVLDKGPTKELNSTTITVEAKYSISFFKSKQKSLHYNGRNSFLFVNATKIYQSKAKDSKIQKYPMCLGNISGDFSANNMKKKQD